MTQTARLALTGDEFLAYRKSAGRAPGVVFLSGFRSDMNGTKAKAIEAFCQERGTQFICFDYRGHGSSGKAFEDCTLGDWKADVLSVLDQLADAPQVLVGSSMGGWLILLAAKERPEKVAALLGLAAAPDFTEHLLVDAFSDEQKTELTQKGKVLLPDCMGGTPYPITLDFISESADHLVLDAPIDIHCPVHLIHGLQDEDVPWEFSLTLNEKLATKDVKTTLVEDGDHRLSSEKHLGLITRALGKMLDRLEEEVLVEG